MEAKKFTNNCYMMTDSYGTKLGFAMIRDNTVLFTYDLEFYDDIESIAKKFGESVIYTELPSDEDAIKEIDGYPIKHDVSLNIDDNTFNNEPIKTYNTREGSNVVFCAGWWVIVNNTTVYSTLSPKLSTLTENCVGPFKNKFDCQAEANRVTNERKSV